MQEGEYMFQLIVTDSSRQQSTAVVTVTVQAGRWHGKGFGLRSYRRNGTWPSDKPNLVANSLTLSTVRKSVLQELNLNKKPVFFGSSESYADDVSKLWNKDKMRVILRPLAGSDCCVDTHKCVPLCCQAPGVLKFHWVAWHSGDSWQEPPWGIDSSSAHGPLLGSMKTQDFVFLQIEITLRIVRLLLDKDLCFRTFLEVAC